MEEQGREAGYEQEMRGALIMLSWTVLTQQVKIEKQQIHKVLQKSSNGKVSQRCQKFNKVTLCNDDPALLLCIDGIVAGRQKRYSDPVVIQRLICDLNHFLLTLVNGSTTGSICIEGASLGAIEGGVRSKDVPMVMEPIRARLVGMVRGSRGLKEDSTNIVVGDCGRLSHGLSDNICPILVEGPPLRIGNPRYSLVIYTSCL